MGLLGWYNVYMSEDKNTQAEDIGAVETPSPVQNLETEVTGSEGGGVGVVEEGTSSTTPTPEETSGFGAENSEIVTENTPATETASPTTPEEPESETLVTEGSASTLEEKTEAVSRPRDSVHISKAVKERRSENDVSVDIAAEVEKEQKKTVSILLEKARLTIQFRKLKRIQKVLQLFDTQETVTNNDVQKLLRVTNRTARNYFDELEKLGRITQVGDVGRGVYYTKSK